MILRYIPTSKPLRVISKQNDCVSCGRQDAWPPVASGIPYLLCPAGRRFFCVGLRLCVHHGVLEEEHVIVRVARRHLIKTKTVGRFK